jgi:hypothetical protein
MVIYVIKYSESSSVLRPAEQIGLEYLDINDLILRGITNQGSQDWISRIKIHHPIHPFSS